MFPRLIARLAARRRDDLPLAEAALRADLALSFAAVCDADAVWPEGTYPDAAGARLGLLVRRPAPEGPVAIECRYAHRASPGQAAPSARQLGDLLRDAIRLHRGFGTDGLPIQVLLCTEEFRTYLAGLHPPLRPLRADSAGTEVAARFNLDDLDDAARHRLVELTSNRIVAALTLTLDVLAYAPVGPLHLAMWRVVRADVEQT